MYRGNYKEHKKLHYLFGFYIFSNMNVRAFWSRVKTGIKEKGVTQAEAAKACRLSFPKFRNWMSKNMIPPLSFAHRISKYLGVSLEYLISGKGTDKVSKTNEEVLVLLKEAERKLAKVRRVIPG